MSIAQKSKSFREVIGLIPAAGTASRIAPLPCSKELYPVGFRKVNGGNEIRPKVVTQYLLEKMRLADITKAFIILREGKWDIPKYFGDGKMIDMNLGYLMMDLPFGVPYTLDQAYPFVQEAIVALGFPDIIFQPDDAYMKLLKKQAETNADIVLGLFPAYQPHKTDMVELDEKGRVLSIRVKPEQTRLSYAWEIAVWSPVFTHYMHDRLSSKTDGKFDRQHNNELFVGDMIQSAIRDKMCVESVLFPEGNCLDIGTPEDLVKAVKITNEILEGL